MPVAAHAPAPGGRPGGYPVTLSRAAVALDLPDGTTEAAAVALNERAAAWDGIEEIEADGTVVLTRAAAEAAQRVLGVDLGRMPPDGLAALATRLRR